MQTLNPDIPNIPNTPDLATRLSYGSGNTRPVVMFPVRLETRFFPHTAGGFELRVRVYPDKAHIDSHEPGLTPAELTWGKHFWEQTWLAGSDQERLKTAWRQLADRFDPPRATWIARALKPTNPDDRLLQKPPRFPSPATKAEAWTRAPQTRVLPNMWVVLGYKNGRLVVNVKGSAIPDLLATGPDPKAIIPDTPLNADQLTLDAGMKWMIDFDEAEKAGMGIRARLTVDEAAAGLDFLLVMGIRDTEQVATDGRARLVELFNAHRYADGLSFVPYGTPSNNTADAPSGFSSADAGHEESYLAERVTPAFQAGDGSNADVLTNAFGLSFSGPVLANLPNGSAKELLDARHMNTALWQATWGYFLLQMLGVGKTGESPLSDEDIAWARSHFIDHVRASGPLPALRIGKQPYGVLPVTSLNAWKPPLNPTLQHIREAALRDFLIRLRDGWRRNSSRAPRLGRGPDDPSNNDLAEVLSMDGLSSSYSIRHLTGRQYMEHLMTYMSYEYFSPLWDFAGETPSEQIAYARMRQRMLQTYNSWWPAQEQMAIGALQTVGATWRPRLAKAVFSPPEVKLAGPLVQAGQSASLSPNYIESLLAARDLTAIGRDTILQPSPRTLLYLLLRHSMLLEYGDAAAKLLIKKTMLQSAMRREPEIVGLPAGQTMQTVWQQLAAKIAVPGEASLIEVGKYLLGPSGEPYVAREPGLKPLSDFRASLAHLKSLDPGRLEELMAGTLDLCSHRLDAWITSLAAKRLSDIRKSNPAGVLFGGYGWVMNLKPALVQPQTGPIAGEPGPVFQAANNPGFTHTPSLTQAATAAVLRSGHLTHAGNQDSNDLLAIDLSSERVRLAEWVLDGVRQGQPLGALLGYRFERRLQEAKKAQFIAPFRELAPLVARKLNRNDEVFEPVEAVAANNVVDGLALLRRWQKGKSATPPQWDFDTIPFGLKIGEQTTKLPPLDPNNADYRAVQNELAVLEYAVDAVSDALMAESVYQVVRGNPLRAASTVESIAGGETPPPELESLRTPRTGIALTHRLVTLFSGEPSLAPEWPLPAASSRASAEPHLNAWAAKLLGNPASVRCAVERLDPATGSVVETKEIRLNALNMAPLDFIYALEGGGAGQQAEIEQRIFYTIMRNAGGFPADSLLRVNPGRKPEWPAAELGYGEFSELLRTARKLLTGVRAIDADDLNPPERSANSGVDAAELDKRAADAEQWLRATANGLQTQLVNAGTADLEALRGLILRSAGLGVGGAVPVSASGDTPGDRHVLAAQAESIQRELARRTEQLTALSAGLDAATAGIAAGVDEKRDFAVARLRLVFGKAFVVLPRFSATNVTEFEKALADSDKVQGGDPLASTTWFQRMARVREGMARLNTSLSYCEALNTGQKLKLKIAQLPYATDDRWVALPLNAGQSLQGGKTSIAVQSSVPVDVRRPLAGLLIDEWVETVPSTTETTGIAVQYDQPNAAPPQTILIAVPPEIEAPWTVWNMQQVLLETLDLARLRAVDLEALNEAGHYLPAMYFACNTAGETVSTDFALCRGGL